MSNPLMQKWATTPVRFFRRSSRAIPSSPPAASAIVALPTVGLFLIFQRQLVESIKTSGFK